jgi:alkanesulfonate monooxygenase SsuD/methylene tetrahydromethanopterin reductase-like flavin-dependent oxidoreductase (luciferase family)
MVFSNGPRMLIITLPYVDAWNVWFEDYGNRAEGFAALSEQVSAAAREVGRDPAEIERSACVLVVLDRGAGERAATADVPALEGGADRIAA